MPTTQEITPRSEWSLPADAGPDDILRAIGETRNRMDGTLHRLEHRLRPRHLFREALRRISPWMFIGLLSTILGLLWFMHKARLGQPVLSLAVSTVTAALAVRLGNAIARNY